MTYDAFVAQVQAAANLDGRDEVERTIQVVLVVLGERLYWAEREQLAAQLAAPLKEHLSQERLENTRQDVDRFALEEFYERVGARLDVGQPEAKRRAQAVATVLQDAVTQGVMEELLAKLPDKYQELFDAA